jgi:hypothetical protein
MLPVWCMVGRCVLLFSSTVRLVLIVLTIRCSSSRLVSVVNPSYRDSHSLCIENVVREALKQRLRSLEAASTSPTVRSPQAHMAWAQVERLHQQSLYQCKGNLHTVVAIIKVQLSTITYDAGLVRDSCFYAALLLATIDSSSHTTSEESIWEEMNVCLRAIRSMRFAFALSVDRERIIDQEWERRLAHSQVLAFSAPGPLVSRTTRAVYPKFPPPISIPTSRDFQPGPDRKWDGQLTSHVSRTDYEPITSISAGFPSSIYQAPPLPFHTSNTSSGLIASPPSTPDALMRMLVSEPDSSVNRT